jgi:hypothetical protein
MFFWWDMKLCSLLDKYCSFGGTCFLKVQYKPTMKMDITDSSRMLTAEVHGFKVKSEMMKNM